MSPITAFLFALAVVIVPHATARRHKSNHTSGGGNSWDFFVLAQQWPGGYPTTSWPSCTDTWTLHGLWPTRNDSSYPERCGSVPFNMSDITEMESQMTCQWPSYNKPFSSFWSHEWTTHGTCSMDLPATDTQEKFFRAALAVHMQVGVTAVLAAAGITPSDNTQYSISQISQAVEKGLGVVPRLSCEAERLTVIELCVDQALALFPCPPSALHGGCAANSLVYYHTIKH